MQVGGGIRVSTVHVHAYCVTQLSLKCEAVRREREEIERETKWRTQQLQTEYEQRLELER